MTQKIKIILVLVALTFGLILRLYRVDAPLADWHSFRQADTASVTRNFLQNGVNLFIPTYHDLSNLQSGQDNPQGYRMVEFPLYNYFSLQAYHLTKIFSPSISLETASRLTNIIISLINSLLLFFFVKSLSKKFFPAFFSLTAFLFLPFNIYYSRVILPEPTAILFLLLSLVTFRRFWLISALSLSLSFLIKPYTGLIAFPIFVYLSYTYYLKSKILNPKSLFILVSFLLVSILPFLLWRHWIQNYPAGIPYSGWLFWTDPLKQKILWFRGHNLSFFVSLISFKPYWFRWIFYQRITLLILGSFGLIPLFLGFALRDKHLQKINLLSIIGAMIYFAIVAGGNVRHDYYQVLIIPFLSIILGCGLYYISSFIFSSKTISLASLFLVSSFFFISSWAQIKGYYTINNPNIITAGEYANSNLPKNALIIAPYNGDTAFLYQTHRSGWPIEIYEIEKIKADHPQNPIYLISTSNDNYTNSIAKNYPILVKNDKFILIDLQHENQK